MKPTKGDIGAEDIIRALVNAAVAEAHAKTNYEKLVSEMENGTVDVEDTEVFTAQADKIDNTHEQLGNLTALRRRIMQVLFDAFPNHNEMEWCMVKHLAITQNCLFEAYQASDGDTMLERLWLDANEEFVKAMTDFLGFEVTPCSACFSEMLKEDDSNGNR